MNQRTQTLPALMLDDPPVVGAYLDACPECGTRDNAPTTTQRVPGGIQCTYECRDCGQDWITSWWEASHA